jgi:hypothetical protein
MYTTDDDIESPITGDKLQPHSGAPELHMEHPSDADSDDMYNSTDESTYSTDDDIEIDPPITMRGMKYILAQNCDVYTSYG